MKFQLKALAAALVLAASIPAYAAVDAPSSGNGSLMLTVLDTTANVSAQFDLGFNYSDFNSILSAGALGAAANSNQSWNLSTNADYSTAWNLLFSSGATLANLKYVVTAADSTGTYNSANGYISTFASKGGTLSSSTVVAETAAFDTLVSNNNSTLTTVFTNMATVANGSSFANTGAAYAGGILGTGKLNASGNIVTGLVGSTLSVQQIVTGSSSIAASTQYLFPTAATFTLLSNGQLSYVAAVPEADTSAMMLAGLGLMGFIARRRNRKQA